MSGREWSKVSPAIWCSTRFLGLPSDGERLLLLFYMTNSHQNSCGCYRIPDGYAVTDLPGWTIDLYGKSRSLLVDANCVSFDAATSEVYVRRWFKHNPPTGPDHGKGVMKLINRIDSDDIRETVESEFAETEWGAKLLSPDPVPVLPSRSTNSLLDTKFMNGRR